MNNELFTNTKVAAYFIWEYTRDENALKLWYCAEDIASNLEISGFKTSADIAGVLRKGPYEFEYIHFVRHVAFRLYIYSANRDAFSNWYTAEKLIANGEWVSSVLNMANIYFENKDNVHELGIKSEIVRNRYSKINS